MYALHGLARVALLFSLTIALVWISTLFDATTERFLVQTLSIAAGVPIALAGSLLMERRKIAHQLETLVDEFFSALRSRNLDLAMSRGLILREFAKRVQWRVTTQIEDAVEFAKFVERFGNVLAAIRNRDMRKAYSLTIDISGDDVRHHAATFDIDFVHRLCETHFINAAACRAYVNNESGGIEIKDVSKLAETIHQGINSLDIEPVKMIEAYFNTVDTASQAIQEKSSRIEDVAHSALVDNLLIGTYGALALIRSQFPYSEPSQSSALKALCVSRKLQLPGDTEATIDHICALYLCQKLGFVSLRAAVRFMFDRWVDHFGEDSLLVLPLRNNFSLLSAATGRQFAAIAAGFEKAGRGFVNPKYIAMINGVSSIISDFSRGSQSKDMELLNDWTPQLTAIESSLYFADGAILNLRTCDLLLGHESRGVDHLEELARSSKNFMVRTTAARNLAVYFARIGDLNGYAAYAGLHAETCGTKGLQPSLATVERARTETVRGGSWYFVREPFAHAYFAVRQLPWDHRVTV